MGRVESRDAFPDVEGRRRTTRRQHAEKRWRSGNGTRYADATCGVDGIMGGKATRYVAEYLSR